MQTIRAAIEDARVDLQVRSRDLDEILGVAVDLALRSRGLDAAHRQTLIDALLAHSEDSAAIGHAVAVPHCYIEGIFKTPVSVFLRLEHPVNLDAPDGVPTRFLFVLMGPPGDADGHLDELMHIARLTTDSEFRYDLSEARTPTDLLIALDAHAERKAVPAPTEAADEGLEFTGRFAGGLMDDVRRKASTFKKEIRDGIHPKTIGASLFLFFACVAPAVTFGGLMGQFTGGDIGAVEMLVVTAIGGVIYALCAGQPLIVLGGIGPLLIFTGILYQLCLDMGLPFLPTYAWVGLWTGLFLVILAVTDASALMRFFTRFTNEIFSALMSLMYIYEAVRAIAKTFNKTGSAMDAALLTLLLAVGTFYIATQLSRMRKSKYLNHGMREFLADFGPAIAMAIMTVVAILTSSVTLDGLATPEQFGTTSGRAWLVDPTEAPVWIWGAAAAPALLAALLIALNQNITGKIINSPEHKLQNGPGYHLDLAVVGGLVAGASMFGLPWLTAATVRSLAHLRSLATVEESIGPDGQAHDQIVHMRETRITGLVIHILIGSSLLVLGMLQSIPMAVLYGLFLYMGMVSLNGVQFVERLMLWPMDPNLYPRSHYVRRVPLKAVHRFTLIQLLALSFLAWSVAFAPGGLKLLFPLFIVMLIPLRFWLKRLFEPKHLAMLDADEAPDEESDHWTT